MSGGYTSKTLQRDREQYDAGRSDAKAKKDRNRDMTYSVHSMYHHGYDDELRAQGLPRHHSFSNSTPFQNGRARALAEIAGRVENAAPDMSGFQKEITSRLGSKIYDYCGLGSNSVSIKPDAPGGVKTLIEASAKAHGIKVNK